MTPKVWSFFLVEGFLSEKYREEVSRPRFQEGKSLKKVALSFPPLPPSLPLPNPPLPISLSPRSRTSPSCTTTVSPPHHAGRARSSCESTPASSSDAIALPKSPWMSPTGEEEREFRF